MLKEFLLREGHVEKRLVVKMMQSAIALFSKWSAYF
jgi:hypothetical protein